MVRSYLRHEPTAAFGVICSSSSRSLLHSDGKTAIVPALEDVLVWDVKRGAQLSMWHDVGHRARVTAIARAPATAGDQASSTYAVGYEDGSIRLWRWAAQAEGESPAPLLTFNGHKTAVTALSFDDADGLRLASGSQDTDVILWDVVAETGLFRLRGHRNAITDVAFLPLASSSDEPSSSSGPSGGSASQGHLLSVSKDGLLKLWDLGLQHCIETVVPGKGELCSLAVAPSGSGEAEMRGTSDARDTLIITGSSEGEVRLFEVSAQALAAGLSALAQTQPQSDEVPAGPKFIVPQGKISIAAARRITQIGFSSSARSSNASPGRFLAVSSSDRAVQMFRIRSAEDMRKKLARRRKRAEEKAKKKGSTAEETAAAAAEAESEEPTWEDRIEPYCIVRPTQGRIRSFAFADDTAESAASTSRSTGTPLLLALSTNALEVQTIPAPPKSKVDKATAPEPALACGIDLPGHRSEVRALALSSDDGLLASADSAGLLKIWNVATGRCVRTLPCGYALCVTWLPDDRHVLVGCKDGTLRSYDIPAGEPIETLEAHTGPLWSIAMAPHGLSCVTASADKDVKFWEFESSVPEEEERQEGQAPPRPHLSLAHTRTLKMTDDVLFARFSPNGKLLALSLLDCTVKVFFADSLKFFLSLYGHKLPVLSLDISSDSKLCVTVSADKNAKIWGLDFGDCHRSLFAHEEAVMSVAFEQGGQGGGLMGGREGASHHFWTVGRDGRLKHWDGDRFELIQTLEGHHGEVWAVAAGHKGTMAVTAGADRSLRTWEKTDEPLFLEEEREKELERLYDGAAPQSAGRNDEGAIGSLADGANPDAEARPDGAAAVNKETKDTLIAGERLMEALDLADEDLAAFDEWQRAGSSGHLPARSPILMAAFGQDEEPNAHRYVLRVTEKIPAAQLEDALLVLPFDKVVSLMRHLDTWARKEWSISLVARILFFLLRTHHAQIVANRVMRTTLTSLRGHLRAALRRQKTTVGFNLAALRYIRAQHVQQRTTDLYEKEGLDMDEETVRARIEEGARRKRKLAVA